MKVITHTTVKYKAKDGHKHLAPGEHELPDDVAADLLKRGHAKTPAAAAKAAAEADKGGPSVSKGGKAGK